MYDFCFLNSVLVFEVFGINCRMLHRKNTRFDLAGFMKARKEARSKVLQENRKLQAEYKKVERVQEKVG